MNIPEVTKNFRSATLTLCYFILEVHFLHDLQEFHYAKHFSLEEGETKKEKERRMRWREEERVGEKDRVKKRQKWP